MNATYGFAYCGSIGIGAGILRINGSDLVGADYAGGSYRGRVTYDQATGGMEISFEMTVPAGLPLVQGASAQDVPMTRSATVKVPAEFGDGKPFEIYVPPGPVTLMARRIADDYAWMADGVTVEIKPKQGN